ncbi:condensation domain-containing protein [Cylindrospermum sp. FACHB-282]|uniref:condensation domain-containing protein n=1 Tax=Cylindrospermum sp. FACHB-282 TaxID=2692794 RepID=UPI00168A0A48|nr:condensation domain-containing protein [Cylindrospermum sp. FACHB-282]MBD2385748.1 AMP-binding protein [Cylindrospermum sp. FACHB-282]
MTKPSNGLKEILANCFTVVDLLRYRSSIQPDSYAFTFLQDGETQTATLTYQELDRRSQAIAFQLQALGYSGERALLLYPPGLDYLAAFFGCLYANVVAVPAYPPRNQRNTPRIQAIVADAEVRVALTTTAILPTIQSLLAEKTNQESLHWLTTDNLEQGIAASWQAPAINPEAIAFLQYTSGSTGTPKGVMLSHGNLLHNAATTYQLMGHSPSSKFVSWLPAYHDMGLIGGILQPLYGGFPCIFMAPASFLQRPYRWLQTISHYQGTTSGGPNFAYELCSQKITPEQKATLDLSSWSVAFNGAEPIRQDTLERFAASFASCGFRPEAFYPCYGMAEATLMISGSQKTAAPTIQKVQKAALASNKVIVDVAPSQNIYSLVGCGQSIPDQKIIIAHPEKLVHCQPDEVGEIWVSGPSIGKGYWNRPEQTEQAFGAYLKDPDEGPFLRTGDLGFLHNGQLFITGRSKDLIIIRGRNLYPQDIELTAESSHPSLRLGSCAAFAVDVDNEERLVVVQELEFRAKPHLEEVTKAIRQAVAQEYEVQAYAVVLIKPGTIPKTSSGKIQRRACKAEFLASNLQVVGESILDSADIVSSDQPNLGSMSYLQALVAQVLKIPLSQVQPQQPLTALGIDSLMAFEIKNQIEVDFGVVISVTDLLQDASIADIFPSLSTSTKSQQPELKPIPRDGYLPLCLAQERLWFLDQLEPGNPFYNVPIAVHLTGKLNVTTLEQSLNEVVQRHEALRTSFLDVDGKPVQAISDYKLTLPVVELLGVTLAEALPLATEFAQQPFDLSQQPLLRVQLLHLGQQEYVLLLAMHHIISDGWSIGILIQELAAIYQAFSHNLTSPLPELPIQYADFAYWQRKWLQGENLNTQINYWKQQLRGNLPILQLPTDRPRPAIQTFIGKKQFFEFPQTLRASVNDFNQREGVTQFMTLIAVFKTLLYCYSKQTEIVVGSPVAGRNKAETQGLIGFFINTLVLRTDLSGNPSFRELLGRVRQVALGAYAHPDLPFEKLVEELQPERDLSHNPLFQVMFILQNASIPTIELPELTLHPLEVDSGTSKFDLKFSIWESPAGFQGSLEYKTDLFNPMTIKKMSAHFEMLLSQIVAQPDISLNELANILALADKEEQFNQAKKLEDSSLQKLKLSKRKAIRQA